MLIYITIQINKSESKLYSLLLKCLKSLETKATPGKNNGKNNYL